MMSQVAWRPTVKDESQQNQNFGCPFQMTIHIALNGLFRGNNKK